MNATTTTTYPTHPELTFSDVMDAAMATWTDAMIENTAESDSYYANDTEEHKRLIARYTEQRRRGRELLKRLNGRYEEWSMGAVELTSYLARTIAEHRQTISPVYQIPAGWIGTAQRYIGCAIVSR